MGKWVTHADTVSFTPIVRSCWSWGRSSGTGCAVRHAVSAPLRRRLLLGVRLMVLALLIAGLVRLSLTQVSQQANVVSC